VGVVLNSTWPGNTCNTHPLSTTPPVEVDAVAKGPKSKSKEQIRKERQIRT
jgi:hypothetical protein